MEGNTHVDVLCASLTPDRTGVEASFLVALAQKVRPAVIMVDWPASFDPLDYLAPLTSTMTCDTAVVLTSWFGDATSRSKTLCCLGLGAEVNLTALLTQVKCPIAEPLAGCLLPLDALDPRVWTRNVQLTTDPRMQAGACIKTTKRGGLCEAHLDIRMLY